MNVFSGVPLVRSTDVTSAGFGNPQSHTRSFSGLNNTGNNGNGWAVINQPYLVVYNVFAGNPVVAYIESGQSAMLFSVSGNQPGTWNSHLTTSVKISYDSAGQEWTLTDAQGNSLVFMASRTPGS